MTDALRQLLRGELPPDPCRGLAGHWGGGRGLEQTSDAPRGSMERIECEGDHAIEVYSTAATRRAAGGES